KPVLVPSAGAHFLNFGLAASAISRAFSYPLGRKAMKLPHRRQFLHLAAGAAALPAVSPIAGAQSYPAPPVRVIVGFAAGGNTDIIARLLGQWLSERLGQPFVVENRPGAGTITASQAVAKAEPDGYTILLFSSSTFVGATLYEKLNFNFVNDIVPIASVT